MQINWICKIDSPDHLHDYEIPAVVPGCVHTDLMRAGLVPDPYWRDNNEQLQWIEACDVTYTGTFTLDTVSPDIWLVFRGLDVYAGVSLNGKKLGETDNMNISWEYPVSDVLTIGENTIEVAFRSPIKEVEGLPWRDGAFTTERMYTRRVQCTYGWDWVGRFVTMGIWKPVELIVRHPDYIGDRNDGIYVYTKDLNSYAAQVALKLHFTSVTGNAWTVLEIEDPDGAKVWSKKRRILLEDISEYVDILSPALWYPSGYGAQPLYTLTVKTYADEALEVPTEVRIQTFGIRTVTILELEDLPDSYEADLARTLKATPQLMEWDRNEGSSCFWLLVNGVRVFCQGANWVPCEPFPSEESEEKINRIVSLAKTAGVNMLRIWGGGIFGHESFFAACDREGVMVTQDFLMACGHYPEDDPAYLAHMRKEAKEAALCLRNHPSLVWWSGDNENAIFGDENMPQYNGRASALLAIGPELSRLDPMRRFLPSSPYGGVPYASGVRGTSHNTQFLGTLFAWIRLEQWTDYRETLDTYLNRFTAEQPAIGMPFVSCLRKFMTDEDIFGDDTSMSEYHTKNNPGLGEITVYGYVDRFAKGIFGAFKNGADRVKKMQWLQCEWIRLSLELARRHAWYSSGLIYWMWNDCWPAANGWSIVDYYAMPKPAYYAFKRTAKPVIGSIQLTDERTGTPCTRVYLSHNGVGESSVGTCRLYRYNIVTGQEDYETYLPVNVPAGSTAVLCDLAELPLTNETVLIADIETTCGCDRAFSLPRGVCYGNMPFADCEATICGKTDDTVTVGADETIPYAFLDIADTVLDDNGFFLKKGETKICRILR